MNTEPHGFALIDRLATGELHGDERRELFDWLDREPANWRRCALALLESRELEEAFAECRMSEPRPLTTLQLHRRANRFHAGSLLALAASVLIAFSLGAFVRGYWPKPVPMIVAAPHATDGTGTALANKDRGADDGQPSPPGVVQQPTEPIEKAVAAVAPIGDPIPPYVRSQWERHGYQVKSQQVKLPVVLPDGHRLMVPANEVQVNYVGQRTY